METRTELIYALESPDGSRRFATLREDGEDVSAMVVIRAGKYDGGTTAMIQDNLL